MNLSPAAQALLRRFERVPAPGAEAVERALRDTDAPAPEGGLAKRRPGLSIALPIPPAVDS